MIHVLKECNKPGECTVAKLAVNNWDLMCHTRGPSINDVTQIFGVFGPPPPLCHAFTQLISTVCHTLGNPPSPLECDIIYEWSLDFFEAMMLKIKYHLKVCLSSPQKQLDHQYQTNQVAGKNIRVPLIQGAALCCEALTVLTERDNMH